MSRQAARSEATRAKLVAAGRELFAKRGYAGVGTEEIVRRARVTRGALYHHFPSKLALFESVFDRLQEKTTREIEKKISRSKDPWERAQVGLQAFLEVCREPHFRRICLQEGPVALGHERWTEAERAASLGIVQRTVDDHEDKPKR